MSNIKRRIDDYGVIDDLRTCALIANDGTIDYLCWPELDSPSIFAALLDSDDDGLFSLAPDWQHARQQQLYLPDTNILQTRWLDDAGVAEITDYMPICDKHSKVPRLVRRVKIRPPFTCAAPERHRGGDEGKNDSAVAQFTLQAGEHAEFVFDNDDDPHVANIATERCFHDMLDYWRRWRSHSSYRGRWQEMVRRWRSSC